jgi:putative tryptophan/tyrosine transport system substrate-binding protein
MRRRAFTAGALALAAAPLAARAQQPKGHRIAVINVGRTVEEMSETGHILFQAFFGELRRLGYAEGGNLAVSRWSGVGLAESRYRELARNIVALAPDVIVANSSRLLLAFKAETQSIPIVMMTAADPVASGLVERLARPGGNITGFASDAAPDEATKRLQLLVDCVPGLRAVAFLATPQTWDSPGAKMLRDAARQLGLTLHAALIEGAVTDQAIKQALSSIADPSHMGIITNQGGEILSQRRAIAEVASALRLPGIGFSPEDARAGLLLSYGPRQEEAYRSAAGYVDRILKGAQPGDLPVQLPTRFTFAVNLKTAKSLGLIIPEPLLVFATEVIE